MPAAHHDVCFVPHTTHITVRFTHQALLSLDPDRSFVLLHRRSPLYAASEGGHIRCVRLLLSAGARVDVNAQEDMGGGTALLRAISSDHVACAKALILDPRVDVNKYATQEDPRPEVPNCVITPLNAALHAGHNGVVELLLGHPKIRVDEADVLSKMSEGLTILSATDPMQAGYIRRGVVRKTDRGEEDGKGDDGDGGGKAEPADRGLVLLLRSRLLSRRSIESTLDVMKKTMIERGAAHTSIARIVVPVLEAELRGKHRWCAGCLTLSPDQDLASCTGCSQVAYCCGAKQVEGRTFAAGDRVAVVGTTRADLNGLCGTISDFNAAKKRFAVMLDGGKSVSLKRLNLESTGETAAVAGSSGNSPATLSCQRLHWRTAHRTDCPLLAKEGNYIKVGEVMRILSCTVCLTLTVVWLKQFGG